MAITAEDIQNQSFNVDRRGYDIDEVDVFLERVAAEVDFMNARIAELEQYDGNVMDMDAAFAEPVVALEDEVSEAYETSDKDARIAELEQMLAEKNDDSSAIAAALVSAQRTAKDIIDKAKAEAADIIADAKADADNIITKAENARDKVEAEISELDAMHDDTCEAYAASLREFIDDATAKLNHVEKVKGKVKPVSQMGHARFASPNQAPMNPGMGGVGTFNAPIATNATVMPAAPVASGIEKDMSGFGDASDDFFDFVDVD